nr:DUF1302 family protein [uncultured Desulfobacter sp.]
MTHDNCSDVESVNLLLAINKKEDQDLDALFSAPEQNSVSIDAGVIEDLPTEPAENNRSNLILSGELRNETAYRIDTPHHLSKVENIFDLKSSGSVSDNLSYVAGARLAYDAVFDLTNEYNHSVESDQELNVDIRDTYIDLNLGKFDLRLGNQQIVWGQAVGLFFADIVNPKDLREYILPDLDQIRIPVPAANIESYYNDYYFQVIFIPFPEFNEFGKQGSEFDFSRQLYNLDADIILNDPADPSNSLENSEIGGRIGWFKNGWDLALFYFYDMYNFPVNYRFISAGTSGTHPVTITYKPEYERIHRIGSTFSKEFMDAIFKGEFIYNSEMFFESSDISDMDGITKSPSFNWLMGVDYTFFNTLDTNFQIMQNFIINHDNSMSDKKYSTSFSVWLKTSFFENRIEPECFFVASLNQRDWLIRPKLNYIFNDKIKITIGGDLFYGEPDGSFGIFNQNDRGYVEILYKF